MPRFPEHSSHAASIRALTFSAFGSRISELRAEGRLIPLHLGDTFFPPPGSAVAAAALDDLASHLYAPTTGLPELRDAIASHVGVPVDRLHVSPGATGGLSVAVNVLFEPGDEVIVLTPSWPLIFGILQRTGVTVVEVPVGEDGWPDEGLPARLREAVTPRTAGIYFCQPNNPVGFVYTPDQLQGVAGLAGEHDLWLLIDEADHDLVLDGSPLCELMDDEAVARRAVFVRSFSKTWALAGERVGFIVGPDDLMPMLARVGTHMIYHTAVPSQRMALGAMAAGEPFVAGLRGVYRATSDETCKALAGRVEFRAPQAGYYVWLDLRDRCPDGQATLDWMRRLLDETGVTLAPGVAFGQRYDRFARLCFTAVPSDRLAEGLSRVAAFLG